MQITDQRLYNQHLYNHRDQSVRELIDRMGAMQAQDFNQAKWALGVRLPGFTEDLIDEAFNRGDLIRTHLMRPTWHFVSPDDIYWLIDLTARQVKSAYKTRNIELELTPEVLNQCYDLNILPVMAPPRWPILCGGRVCL
jgi:hypothetical protein